MQAKYTVAIALAAGFALGAGAIHGLHAKSAPPAYVTEEIAVKDEAGYKKIFSQRRKRPSMTMAATSLAGSIRHFR
jgi:hypothetical protein